MVFIRKRRRKSNGKYALFLFLFGFAHKILAHFHILQYCFNYPFDFAFFA